MKVIAIAVGFALCVCAGAATGQRPASMRTVDSGQVVRAWLDAGQLRGRLLMPLNNASDSVLYCKYPGPPCVGTVASERTGWLQLAGVQHLDVQVGNRARKGAWIGGVFGGLIGVLGACGGGFYSPPTCPRSPSEQVFFVIVRTVTMGAVGAIIGSGFPRFERMY